MPGCPLSSRPCTAILLLTHNNILTTAYCSVSTAPPHTVSIFFFVLALCVCALRSQQVVSELGSESIESSIIIVECAEISAASLPFFGFAHARIFKQQKGFSSLALGDSALREYFHQVSWGFTPLLKPFEQSESSSELRFRSCIFQLSLVVFCCRASIAITGAIAAVSSTYVSPRLI